MRKTVKRKKRRSQIEKAASSIVERKEPIAAPSPEVLTTKTAAQDSVEKTAIRNAKQRKKLLIKLNILITIVFISLFSWPILLDLRDNYKGYTGRFPLIVLIVSFFILYLFFIFFRTQLRDALGFLKTDVTIWKLRSRILLNSISIGLATFLNLYYYGFVGWITNWLISNYKTIGQKLASVIAWVLLAMVSGVIGNRADALLKRLLLDKK